MLILGDPLGGVIVTIPTLFFIDGTTFAVKVLIPVVPLFVPYKDFTSEIAFSVTAIAILPFEIPLNDNSSFLINSPET